MKKRVLRWISGLGYVFLLTAMLLYQAGAFGGRRQWSVAVLGTLLLGAALAVVLVLYIRVSDQLRRQEEPRAGGAVLPDQKTGAEQKTSARHDPSVSGGSYEEIYTLFLGAMEACALSERELEVAWLLYRGYTNRQIGEELYIAESTVKKHVSHIYEKTEVQSRKAFRAYVQATAASVPPPQTDPHG